MGVMAKTNSPILELMAVILVSAAVCCNGQSFKEVNGMNCNVHSISLLAVSGWPYIFGCTDESLNSTGFVIDWCNDLDYIDYPGTVYPTATIQCLATDLTNSMVINNQSSDCTFQDTGTVRLDAVSDFDSPSLEFCILTMDPTFTVETPCRCYEVTFEQLIEPNTCTDSLNAFTQNSIPDVEARTASYTIHCPVPMGLLIPSQINVTWYHNCGTLSSGISESLDQLSLTVDSVGFDHAGTYTCAVDFDGLTRFFHSSICVTQPTPYDATSINCKQTEIMANDGEDVNISCTLSFGIGFPNPNAIRVNWLQNNTTICFNSERNVTIQHPNDTGIACKFFVNDPELLNRSCAPSTAVPVAVTATAQLFLTNIDENDLRNYVIEAHTFANILGSHNVTISRRPTEPPVGLIVGLTVGFVVLLILVVVLLIVFRLQVAAYWKILFGSYEPDDLKYHASIFYLAGSVIDTGATSLVRSARETTIRHLESLGFGRYYDQQTNHQLGMRAEIVKDVVEQSHRTVIILSHEYIKDAVSVGDLQQTIMQMINNGRKIIFILIPGTMENIVHRANDTRRGETRDRYRTIKRMIEQNHAIKWSNDTTFDDKMFKMQLRYAMPKLRRQTGLMEAVVYENGHVAHANGGANGGPNGLRTATVSNNHV